MPYVIVSSGLRIGEMADAVLSDLGIGGARDRRRDVPERVLCVDDDPHAIISTITENNATRFLVDGGKSIRNRERRVALARASELLTDFHRLDRTSLRLAHSFDHLVGAREQRRRHLHAQRLGGLKIDRQLEIGWCLHGKIGRACALENPIDIFGRAGDL
jgi:hypothetical protein